MKNRGPSSRTSAANVFEPFETLDEISDRFEAAVTIYCDLVRAVIEDADENAPDGYRGVTIGYIKTQLGDLSDNAMIGHALDNLNIYGNGQTPEKFTLIPPPVRYPDRHLIGQIAEVPKHKSDGTKLFPYAALRKQY